MKILLCVLICVPAMALPWMETSAAEPATNVQPAKPAGPAVKRGVVRKVDVDEFEKLWQDKKNVVLDVRTKKEFDAGHIPGARNLDVNAPDFEQKISALDKTTVYLVHCAAGARSARACDKMSGLGFKRLVDLAPGFKAWEKAGRKVEK